MANTFFLGRRGARSCTSPSGRLGRDPTESPLEASRPAAISSTMSPKPAAVRSTTRSSSTMPTRAPSDVEYVTSRTSHSCSPPLAVSDDDHADADQHHEGAEHLGKPLGGHGQSQGSAQLGEHDTGGPDHRGMTEVDAAVLQVDPGAGDGGEDDRQKGRPLGRVL